MPRDDKSWFDRPYETWRQKHKTPTARTEKETFAKNRERRLLIVSFTVLAICMVSMFWVIFSEVALWDRDGIKNFGIGMFVLFLIGTPLGLYLAARPSQSPFYSLQIMATVVGGMGALGMILLPVFLHANYFLDFSEPELIGVAVSNIELVGKVGSRHHKFTFNMTQAPFETRELVEQNRQYSHLRLGEKALLVSGKGFFGLRYVREIRSNTSYTGSHTSARD